jgi:hypothetical protein
VYCMFREDCSLENVVIALKHFYRDLWARNVIRNGVELGYNDVGLCSTSSVEVIFYGT